MQSCSQRPSAVVFKLQWEGGAQTVSDLFQVMLMRSVWGPHLGDCSGDVSVARKPALLILHPPAQRELARVRSALCHAGPPASDAGVVGRGADQARPTSGPACLAPPALRVAPSGAPQTPPSFLSHHFMWLAHLFPVSSLCPEEHQLFPRHSACA